MNEYWDERFRKEGRIWGDLPSRTAEYARQLFEIEGVRSVLVPGSGYGRNTRLFSAAGFDVTGVEIAASAAEEARRFDPLSKVHQASVMDMSFLDGTFDAVYCYNVLHLFLANDRRAFLRQCADSVRDGGPMFFTVFSELDSSYGKGRRVEENTFESRPGRPAHYFTEADLIDRFRDMQVVETGLAEDPEDHGQGPHVHLLRYIYVRITHPQ